MINTASKWLKITGVIFIALTFLSFLLSIPIFEMSLAINKKGYFTTEKINGIEIVEVVKDSPANQVGLQKKDIIKTLNGTQIKSVSDFTNAAYDNKGPMVISVKRGTETKQFTLSPRAKYPAGEGPTGLVITDEKMTIHDQNRIEVVTDALIKPYLGYESFPRNEAVGLYALLNTTSSEYISYSYTGDFGYTLRLIYSILLLITTFGIFKKRRYAAYSALIIGVFTLIYSTISFFTLLNSHHFNYLVLITVILEVLFSLLCFSIYAKRSYLN